MKLGLMTRVLITQHDPYAWARDPRAFAAFMGVDFGVTPDWSAILTAQGRVIMELYPRRMR